MRRASLSLRIASGTTFYSNCLGLGPTNGKQPSKFNPVESAPANKVRGLSPRDSSGAVLWRLQGLYGFHGSLEGVWSTGGLPTFFLHYLTASGGCWDTGGLGSRQDSVLQEPGEYL